MDSSGNYGYIKAGADSVTPFRTGNATAAKVLSGYTFANASSPNVTGTMPHLTNRATITHASDNQTKVILADEAFTTINSDGVARFELRYNGDSGYIIPNTLLALPYSKVATAIGLTANKIVKGNTILGITGSAKAAATSQSGKYERTTQNVFSYTQLVTFSTNFSSAPTVTLSHSSYDTSLSSGHPGYDRTSIWTVTATNITAASFVINVKMSGSHSNPYKVIVNWSAVSK